jgi:hypothetical protein
MATAVVLLSIGAILAWHDAMKKRRARDLREVRNLLRIKL